MSFQVHHTRPRFVIEKVPIKNIFYSDLQSLLTILESCLHPIGVIVCTNKKHFTILMEFSLLLRKWNLYFQFDLVSNNKIFHYKPSSIPSLFIIVNIVCKLLVIVVLLKRITFRKFIRQGVSKRFLTRISILVHLLKIAIQHDCIQTFSKKY